MSYDAADDARKSYDVAIGALRNRLENGFDPALNYAIACILPRREREAAAELVRRGFRVWLPMTAHWRRQRNGRKQERCESPLWPGYLLVHLHAGCGRPQDFAPVRRFLIRDGQPATIPGAVLEPVHAAQQAGLLAIKTAADKHAEAICKLPKGARVSLDDTWLLDHIGELQSADIHKREAVLHFLLFNRTMEIVAPLENVRVSA